MLPMWRSRLPRAQTWGMTVAVVRGGEELLARTGHLFAAATSVSCAARDLNTWAVTRPGSGFTRPRGMTIRKLYLAGILLNPSTAQHVHEVARIGAEVRITRDEILETIILDRRIAILDDGDGSYSVLSGPEVAAVASLFEAAWRSGTDLAVYDAQHAELRALAPRVLDLLASGCKDETAARTLGLGVRTYRRRVAELMDALGAESRFQAGARARELGLV